MREILFRGKQKYNGEWVEGFIIKLGKESFSDPERYGIVDEAIPIMGMSVCYNLAINEVIPETVGQYTGITDKNGKRIFEGDIVQCGTGRICKVTFFISQGVSGFDLVAIGGFDAPPPHKWELFSDSEVIGNIHDNLELFERR